jgi:hypothetical protein
VSFDSGVCEGIVERAGATIWTGWTGLGNQRTLLKGRASAELRGLLELRKFSASTDTGMLCIA